MKDFTLNWDVIFNTLEDIMRLEIPKQNDSSKEFEPGETNLGTLASLIEDYNVSLTSLEDVFMSLARTQCAKNALHK